MADNVGNGDGAATSSVRFPSHCFAHRRRKIKRARFSSEDIDSISSLPDEILQAILFFIPTKLAIRTSVLSRRWRHVWRNTPSLSFFDNCNLDPSSVDKILSRYTASKMMRFQLCVRRLDYLPYMYSWIQFAMCRNVENLWLEHRRHHIPEFFYNNSSVKQLYVKSNYTCINPKYSVSWTSLKILTLHSFKVFDKSFAKILSGSPLLETLRLYFCDGLHVLDLRKSPRLKTLEIDSEGWLQGAKIVAPHIHFLRLRLTTNSEFPYTLVDVSSLTEAELDTDSLLIGDHCLQTLEKLQNVEKLTFGENFLKVLSRADLRRFPFQKFKAKVLTLKTTISQDVIYGILRVLQHSPELKKLNLRTMDRDAVERGYDENYLDLYSWTPYRCLEAMAFGDIYSRDVETKHVALFMELVFKTLKTLKKMVVRLGPYRNERCVKELRQKVSMLSHDNDDVSIVLFATKRWIRESKWTF